jgi:hypothetical protein
MISAIVMPITAGMMGSRESSSEAPTRIGQPAS